MNPMLAEIIMFAGNFAPIGWALCEGQLLPINQNQALYSLLGTIYGGDGRTTFALPDLRGRVALQQGNGPGLSSHPLGQRSGAESHNLSVLNLPPHNHAGAVHVSSAAATKSAAAAGDSIAAPGTGTGRDFAATEGFNSVAPNVDLGSTSVAIGNTGSGSPVTNMQPALAINFIISLQGTFPSRN